MANYPPPRTAASMIYPMPNYPLPQPLTVSSSGTPLHYAIRGGHADSVLVLLRQGAHVTELCKFPIVGNTVPPPAPVKPNAHITMTLKAPKPITNITQLSAYDYATLLGNPDVITTLRKFLGAKHWQMLRLLWLANKSKNSVMANVPADVMALIHEQVMAALEVRVVEMGNTKVPSSNSDYLLNYQ